jgi:hypothetical protein
MTDMVDTPDQVAAKLAEAKAASDAKVAAATVDYNAGKISADELAAVKAGEAKALEDHRFATTAIPMVPALPPAAAVPIDSAAHVAMTQQHVDSLSKAFGLAPPTSLSPRAQLKAKLQELAGPYTQRAAAVGNALDGVWAHLDELAKHGFQYVLAEMQQWAGGATGSTGATGATGPAETDASVTSAKPSTVSRRT